MGRRGAIDRVRSFVEGAGFPAFALGLLLFHELLLVVLLLTPATEAGFGAFAAELRVWCFGVDPDTGRLDLASVAGMTLPPALLGVVLAFLWSEPLRAAFRRPAVLVAPVLAAALLVAGAAGTFTLLAPDGGPAGFPFPAVALRTAHTPPELRLLNQHREPVDLAGLRGKVVVITAVYASCPHACPAVLSAARRAVEQIEPAQRGDLRVIALTLDPEHDSPEVLAELATAHDLDAPLYNLLSGTPAEVERVLDGLGIARQRDERTGVIEHVSMFFVLDRAGKLAYRLGLGGRQSDWLVAALRTLLREGLDVG